MSTYLEDAFAHHAWANGRVMEICLGLSPEQLATLVPGTTRSIEETVGHLVDSDVDYLGIVRGEVTSRRRVAGLDMLGLAELARAAAEGWVEFLRKTPPPETVLREIDADDGYTRDAPLSVRLAQALHHGNDHRSQLCAAFAALGIEVQLSVWDWALASGRATETWPEER